MWPDPDQLSVSGWSLERVWCCVSVVLCECVLHV